MMDLSSLTDEELVNLQLEITNEISNRAIPQQIDTLLNISLDNSGVVSGDPWKQPVGAHDSYPLGWIVTHLGKTWQSNISGNVWEPPQGWLELVEPGVIPEWRQPLGAMDAYPLGFEVMYINKHWKSNVDNNVWEPGVYGWDELP